MIDAELEALNSTEINAAPLHGILALVLACSGAHTLARAHKHARAHTHGCTHNTHSRARAGQTRAARGTAAAIGAR